MAEFAQALPFVLANEGGWSDVDGDRGGATNFGITLATAQRHGIETAEDLRQITDEKVAEIYRSDYWRFDGLDSQAVATKCLDLSANWGLRTTVRVVQDILNNLGAGLVSDGIWGPATEGSVNAVEPNHLLALLVERAVAHYRAIVARDATQGKFLLGWLARAAKVPHD